jgi:hypothetical protein
MRGRLSTGSSAAAVGEGEREGDLEGEGEGTGDREGEGEGAREREDEMEGELESDAVREGEFEIVLEGEVLSLGEAVGLGAMHLASTCPFSGDSAVWREQRLE